MPGFICFINRIPPVTRPCASPPVYGGTRGHLCGLFSARGKRCPRRGPALGRFHPKVPHGPVESFGRPAPQGTDSAPPGPRARGAHVSACRPHGMACGARALWGSGPALAGPRVTAPSVRLAAPQLAQPDGLTCFFDRVSRPLPPVFPRRLRGFGAAPQASTTRFPAPRAVSLPRRGPGNRRGGGCPRPAPRCLSSPCRPNGALPATRAGRPEPRDIAARPGSCLLGPANPAGPSSAGPIGPGPLGSANTRT